MKPLLIAGTGYIEILRLISDINASAQKQLFDIIGFLDDNKENESRELYGHRIVGGFKALKEFESAYVVNTIARDTTIRRQTTETLMGFGARFTNVVHPSVCLEGVALGTGNIVGRGSVIEPGTNIGSHNVILHNTVIAHDTKIGSYCFIGHNCSLQGSNKIDNEVFIGTGTTSVPSVAFGSRSKTGINCSVVIDLPEDAVLVSTPSRRLK